MPTANTRISQMIHQVWPLGLLIRMNYSKKNWAWFILGWLNIPEMWVLFWTSRVDIPIMRLKVTLLLRCVFWWWTRIHTMWVAPSSFTLPQCELYFTTWGFSICVKCFAPWLTSLGHKLWFSCHCRSTSSSNGFKFTYWMSTLW